MLSPAKAIAAGDLVFAIGGTFLIAQPFDQQGVSVPGAATDPGPAEAVEFTATFPWGPEINAATSETLPDGITREVGWAHRSSNDESSDPRFEGEMVYTWNNDFYPPDKQAAVSSAVFRIESGDGAWQSRPALGLEFPGDPGYGPFSV